MKNRILSNTIWIITAQCIKALMTLGVYMLTARYLGPSNYGLINYAAAIVSFIAPFMYLGYNNILVQELVHYPDKEGEIMGTAIISSFFSSIICIGLIIIFVFIINTKEKETLLVCSLYSSLLLFQSMDLIIYWFQAKLIAKYSSSISLCAHIIIILYKIYILISGKSIYWFAISSAMEYMVVSLSLLFVYRYLGGGKLKFSLKRMKKMLNVSKYYIISSVMVSVSVYIDRIMIKIMINDIITGYYSAAVTCAAMTTFIFVAIIDSFRPVILEYKIKNKNKYQETIKLLYSLILYLAIIQGILTFCLATPIVHIIFGSSYLTTTSLLKVVVWYTPFSYLGAIRNIWILAEEKGKYLWMINFVSAIVNIVTNLVLIPSFGALGAAIASLISNFITIVVMSYIIKPIRENFYLMISSLNPKILINSANYIINKK